jgi:HAE1 family hydrophobic/amphiphilic exporter-1
VRDSGKKFLLRSIADYTSLEELENRPVTPTIRLKDIARIKYEEPEKRYSVRVNSRPAIAAVVFKEGEANTVEVSRRIRTAFEEMQENPRLSNLYMEILFNQGEVIQDSLINLVRGGLIGGSLAALILFIFLRRIRLTGIVTLAIPLSLLIALTVMFFAGESLNILTILALVIAVGMLVDNSVVVSENIHRMHQEGRSRRDACVQGAGEIALAITMATLTTIVVFVPVALVEGEGQFFLLRLALPISVSLVASLIVALVFIPLSVYLTLPANDSPKRHAVVRWSHERLNAGMRRVYEATFGRLNHLYCRWLAFFLKRRLDLVILLALLFGFTAAVPFKKVDIVEQQEEDQTSFYIDVEVSGEYSFDDVAEYFRGAEQILEKRKQEYGLKGYFIFFRQRGGRMEGWFDDAVSRTLSAKEVGAKLVEELPKKPGLKLHFGRENEAEEAKGSEVFVFRLEGDDPGILAEVAERLEPVVMKVDGVLGIRRGDDPAPNEMALVVDRDRTTASSVNPQVVAGLVGYALRGSSLPKFNQEGREIPVRIRFQEEDRESLSDLAGFQVPVEGGGSVPLSSLTRSRVLESPKAIWRSDKRVSRTVTVELKKEGAKETRERLVALQRQLLLPEGVSFSEFRVQTRQEEIASMIFAAQLSVLFIYLLMGFLFESFILPLSIICTIPLASVGVGWIHYLTGKDVDFLGFVGGILLIGVVVNNGIVFIDYVNRLRARGMDRTRALLMAADRRFRPISMTALTTIVGMIPLTFSGPTKLGISYKSFGLTLIGGMTTATLLTLLVVPVFYTFFDDARHALMRMLRNVIHPKTKTRDEGLGTQDKGLRTTD